MATKFLARMKARARMATIVAACISCLSMAPARHATASGAASPLAVVKALYAAFDKGDQAAIERLIAPDATWTQYGPEYAIPFAGTRKGPKGVADFFATVDATLTDATATQRAFIVSGAMVAVPGTEESRVKATGARYKVDNLHLFEVRNGKIVRFEEFIDSGTILEAFQPASPSRGKALFTTCAGCHGNAGQGRPEMFAPNLTGQDPAYLARQLANFQQDRRGKENDRHGYQMRGRAKALPGDRGVRDVLAYISSLPVAPAPASPVPVKASSQLYESCAACHGAQGEGNRELKAPRLRGLGRAYIATQIRNFRSGMRGYDPKDEEGAMMAAAAAALPDDDAVAAVAAYAGGR